MKKIGIIVLMICMLMQAAFAATLNDASTVTALSVSLVNQDPDPAAAGDIVETRFGLENMGGTSAENLIFELVPGYPFEIVSGEDTVKKVGTIGAYQYSDNMKIIKYNVRVNKDATAGSYELKVRYYKEGSTSTITKSFSIDVESQESAEVIYIDQVELIPGKITPLKFTIHNVGSAPLRDLTFQWENEDDIILPVGSDNTKYIKYIDVGDSVELNYNVVASATATPNLYKLDLSLTYKDPLTGEDKEINTKAGVYVGGATDFDAAFSGVSSGEASFTIANIGSVAASSVTVRIQEQQGWRVRGSNSVIIGNLNEGDYTIASFALTPMSQAITQSGTEQNNAQRPARGNSTSFQRTQSETVNVDIVYTDSRGNRNTITKEVPVDSTAFLSSGTTTGTAGTTNAAAFSGRVVRRNSFPWGTVIWAVVGAGLLTMFFFTRRKCKKERLKNPNYKYKDVLKAIFKKKR